MLRTPENKGGPLTPEVVDQIGAMFYEMACAAELEYDCVVGIPRAGDPFADAFAKAAAEDGREVTVLRMGKVEDESGRKVSGVEGEFRV
jgi:orotate phosphoribosyltransferase